MDREYINQVFDDILDGNNIEAQSKINDLLATKVVDTLDARKIELANRIYNDEESSEEDQETIEDTEE